MTYTRRTVLSSLALTAGAALAQRPPRPKMWKPKLGVLGQFSEANLDWVRQEGFSSMGLWANHKNPLDADAVTDQQIETVKSTIRRSGLHVSVLGCTENHIHPEADARAKGNAYFAKVIELAGKLGVAYVGTASGTMQGRSLEEQVSEILRVYTEK